MELIRPYLPFLIPIVLLQLLLIVVALVDLVRRPKVNGPKWVWVVIILLINFIGPIAYFLVGRREE
ncbi:MAG: PLDc_N domain-containing protein [Anaerolineae bacterium]|nr:PLDc_N domain-containing protein [Anaerolineae bacterium]